MDTGQVLRLRDMLDILEARLQGVTATLADMAKTHAGLPMAARTRSQTATPTTFGLRIAGWLAPLARCLDRLDELRPRLLAVQLGGASGTLGALGGQGIATMEALAAELGLTCPPKPWHSERDSIVELANWLSMVSGLLGRIGADLILLSRSEIAEITLEGGGGSSTMPQKSNPVFAETLVSLARSNAAQAGLAQAALLHCEERDGAAWAIEWLALPPMIAATAAGLRHTAILLDALSPNPERMTQTLAANGGAVHAEALAFALARQMPLAEAQTLVKTAATTCVREGGTLTDHIAAACKAHGIDPPDPDTAARIRTARDLTARAIMAARIPRHSQSHS
jgi:3-carboxy-cis,cis-muconate cycloisomerase